MPIQIKPNEEKDDFIQRCISEEMGYGKSETQSVAICYSYYEEDRLSKAGNQERMVNKLNKKQQELEGACWDNYIQIGMKPGPGGKMVPDCRGPVKS